MTALLTVDGRLLRRAPSPLSKQQVWGVFDGVWTDASEDDDAELRLVSFAEIYDSQPVIAAAINKLTRQGSTLPLKVYKRKSDNERERLFDHPLTQLLAKPVPRSGPVQFKQWIFMPLLTHGNALVAKFREDPDGPPTNLLPVDWRYVEAYASEGGPIEFWATMQTGERRWISVEDTIHVAWQSPNGEVGTSPLAQLRTTILNEDAAQRYQKSIFKNSARPSGSITLPDGVVLTEEIRTEMRKDLDRLYGGVDNAGRPALLPGGAKWDSMAHTAQEAELINQRYVDWEEIQMVFDLPGPLLADLRHGTYSNVTELHKQLYKSVLRPWLTLVEETIQAHLIDPEPDWQDVFVEFDMGEVLRGDRTEEIAALVNAFTNGLLTLNEVRAVLNQPKFDLPEADKPQVQANNTQPLGTSANGDQVSPEAPELP